MDLIDNPAYAAAVEEESSIRDLAFLGEPVELCGVDACALTPRHVLMLNGIKSPFICGGVPTPADIAALLWIVSPKFITGHGLRARWRRWQLCRAIRRRNYIESVKEIREWIDRQMMDAPGGGSSNDAPIASLQASFVDCFGAEYGWTWRETMDTPIAALFQLARMQMRRIDPKKHFGNRLSDAVMAQYLREKNQQRN